MPLVRQKNCVGPTQKKHKDPQPVTTAKMVTAVVAEEAMAVVTITIVTETGTMTARSAHPPPASTIVEAIVKCINRLANLTLEIEILIHL